MDNKLIQLAIDNLDAANNDGYYLDAKDIEELFNVIWSVSEHAITELIFIRIASEIFNE